MVECVNDYVKEFVENFNQISQDKLGLDGRYVFYKGFKLRTPLQGRIGTLYTYCYSGCSGCNKKYTFEVNGGVSSSGSHSKRCGEVKKNDGQLSIANYPFGQMGRVINQNERTAVVDLFKNYFFTEDLYFENQIKSGIELIEKYIDDSSINLSVTKLDGDIAGAAFYSLSDEIYLRYIVAKPGSRAGHLLISYLKTKLSQSVKAIFLGAINPDYYRDEHRFIKLVGKEVKEVRDKYGEHESELVMMVYRKK